MKPLSIFFFLLISFSARSQQYFDSAAYMQQFRALFPVYTFDTTHCAPVLTTEEKLEGLSKVWYEAKLNFANFDLVPRLNWDSAYRAFIPRVMQATDIRSYYQLLQQFNQLLRDGHSRIVEPLCYMLDEFAFVPLVFQWIEGRVVLTEIYGSGPGYADLRKGWVLERINGEDVQEYVRTRISPFIPFSTPQDSMARIYRYELTRGKTGSQVQLEFRTTRNEKIIRSFTRMRLNVDQEPLSFRVLPGNTGYLVVHSFNTESVVKQFDSLFPAILKTNALIIDIRTNGGGNGNNGFEILGRLTDKPFLLTQAVMRKYSPSHRAWNDDPVTMQIERYDWKPYKPGTYNGKVIVLTGASTYSAAEDFTAVFKYMKRGVIVGSCTGGSTGQPLGYPLPGGGIGYVCTKRDLMPDGEEFVGKGICPDYTVVPTLKGLQEQKDEVLQFALQLLAKDAPVKK
ncbi:MAG: S41 family peptidase [Lacibacter sp.]|jgi:C-terminal processing protease CtpA/Prc